MDNNNEENNTAPQEIEDTEEIEALVQIENKIVKKIDSETLEINNDKYGIKTNYRDALDLELLEERYSDLLEKYDFIVGDMSYGKLRLRGFYYDSNKKAPIDMKISHLEDYLLEYCSFGCAYFVLESLETKKKKRSYPNSETDYDNSSSKSQKSKTERTRKKPVKKNYKSSNKSSNRNANKPDNKPENKPKTKPEPKPKPKPKPEPIDDKPVKSNEKKPFIKKSRSDNQSSNNQTERVKEVKNEKGNTRFQIRKKK